MSGKQRHQTNFLDQGAMFEGKYRIVRELGRGGFGMVYLAYQQKMDRHVAIKVLKSGMGELHRSAKERFLREVKIISKLRHPNTVTIHDFGESSNGVLYMVLEFIEGDTVKQILKREGAQPPRRALAWTGQITRSLAEAHRHGVIHRDLKPANVMVSDLQTESDFVKVLDFGIARLLRTDERDLTSVGLPEGERELIGTPRYMSPEQVRGESLGPASDVYSVGLILYEMLVGQPAVQGDTTMALISQQISPQPLRLDGLRALPPRVSELIRVATAKHLEQRFPNAERFGDAVDQTLASIGGPPAGSASARSSGMFRAVDSSAGFSQANPTPGGRSHTGRFIQPPSPAMSAPQSSVPVDQAARTNPQVQRNIPAQHQRSSGFQGNSIHEYHEASAQLDVDLPPPPSDTNPFAVPEPPRNPSEKPGPQKREAPEDAGALGTTFEFVRIALFGAIALIGLYVAFLVVSPIFGHFLSGDLKLIASAILAAAIPLLTALGENSKRERFEVVDKPYDRVVRVFVGTAIFSFGTAVICALAMSGAVVYELRSFPNWFMTDAQRESSMGEFNEKVSLGLAQVVEEATSAIGMYEGKTHADSRAKTAPVVPPALKRLPAPTRPSTRAQQGPDEGQTTDEASQQTPPESGSAEPSGAKGGDDEYIRW